MRRHRVLGEFGARVRILREADGFSQERLAERAGMSRNYLGSIERGEVNPSLLKIASLARGLNVSLERLFVDVKH